MKIEIKLDKDIEPGTLYFIPKFVKCIHCQHEIPIGMLNIYGNITDNGGCGKVSKVSDYAKYFGMIRNVRM